MILNSTLFISILSFQSSVKNHQNEGDPKEFGAANFSG